MVWKHKKHILFLFEANDETQADFKIHHSLNLATFQAMQKWSPCNSM